MREGNSGRGRVPGRRDASFALGLYSKKYM